MSERKLSRAKVTIAGAGNVGASCALRLAERDQVDVVLLDRHAGLARGRALDLGHAGPVAGYEPRVRGTAAYEDTAGSDVCIIASGLPRRPGMSRDDLMAQNAEIVEPVAARLSERSPDAILIVVTSPLEAMCHVALDASGFSRQRVLGMSGIVDSARLRVLLASELGVSVQDVTALVLGGHAERMVPVLGSANVAGAPVSQLIEAGRLEEMVQRTRDSGSEVAELVEEGSAHFAPSAAVVQMIDSILGDRMRVLACAALCQGEYGIRDVFAGVPCRLGAHGLEEIVRVELTAAELKGLHACADAVSEQVAVMTSLRSR